MIEKEKYNEAMPIAITLFNQFFNELMTALENTIKNSHGAQFYSRDANQISYLMGKEDAFKEIVYRIKKERDLALNETLDKEGDQATYERDLSFRIARDKDVEAVYPYKEWMPRLYDGRLVMRHRSALADMLEHYFKAGFMMGCGHLQGKELKEFNPEEFGDTLIEALIPDELKYKLEK